MNTLTPDNPLVQQNLKKIKKKLRNKEIKAYFYPSKELVKIISVGKHPMIQGLNKKYASILVQGKGIIIQKKLLFEYLSKNLDKKNNFIFNNGEVRLLGTEKSIVETLQEKQEL